MAADTRVIRDKVMSSKLFRSGSSARGRGGSTGSAGELTAQNKEIIEFDHRFDARICDHAPVRYRSGTLTPVPSVMLPSCWKNMKWSCSRRRACVRKLCGAHNTKPSSRSHDHQHSTFRVHTADAVTEAYKESYSVTMGTKEGPLGLNLVSSSSEGEGRGFSAAVEGLTPQLVEASSGEHSRVTSSLPWRGRLRPTRPSQRR